MASSVVYQRKRALVVGINKYPCDPLQYCINDAEDLKAGLERINFDVSLGVDCNLNEFYHIIDEFVDTTQRDDLVLFYFAGHGKQMEDENYLLPSDYNYDYRGHERDYIPNHAVNVKHIMKKIDDRKCRITIYLFDCCRELVRTRSMNAKQGLLPMNAPSQTLIIYACAPGNLVQDETRNNRNGSFIENLLKYIETPNKDIEEIMKDVACDVNLQTNGFQLPYRTSSLTSKVCLVTQNDQECHPTAWLQTITSRPSHPSTFSTDINILLLGHTGVGKSTFINAFANYLVYNSLDAALQGEMQAIIPLQFPFINSETYETSEIMVGCPNENEHCNNIGETCTQNCRSYNFTIGNRVLRLIDTPPIGDTRGPLRDIKNTEHIFTYVSQYEHLNGICILLNPNETRLSVPLRYSIKELLSRLHINTQHNIIWVFTNIRSTYYKPGPILRLLSGLLNDIVNCDLRFHSKNMFSFDNEGVRALALNKDHSEYVNDYLPVFRESWNRSTTAFSDLISCILSCKSHMTHESFFLNIVRQLTIKLFDRISEKFSLQVSMKAIDDSNAYSNSEKTFMHDACVRFSEFIKLNSILTFNDDTEEYSELFLKEEKSECIIRLCTKLKTLVDHTDFSNFLKKNSIDPFKIYIKYYIDSYFEVELIKQMSSSHFLRTLRETTGSQFKQHIMEYIRSMFCKEFIEQTQNAEYLKFLQDNSMSKLQDDTIERIGHLLFEQLTLNSDDRDFGYIHSLDNLISDCIDLKKLFTTNISEQTTQVSINTADQLTRIKDIMKLLHELCALPINGAYFRQYMVDLGFVQRSMIGQGEVVVKLPTCAQSSDLMQKLRTIIEQK